MDLIIGGAYQGKLEYAMEKYGFKETEVYFCTEEKGMSFDEPCVYAAEEFVMYCLKRGLNAVEIFEENRDKWKNSVFICREIFSGVVPMDALLRKWRDETGRVLTYLSGNADTVTRLFCGIPQKLK